MQYVLSVELNKEAKKVGFFTVVVLLIFISLIGLVIFATVNSWLRSKKM